VNIIESSNDQRVQEHYTRWLHEFTAVQLVEVALCHDYPHEIAATILCGLRSVTGTSLPLHPCFNGIRKDLATISWIPIGNALGAQCGVAPRDVLDNIACQPEVQPLVQWLVRDLHAPQVGLASAIVSDIAEELRAVCAALNDQRGVAIGLTDVVGRNALRVPPAWVTVPLGLVLGPAQWPVLRDHLPLGQKRLGWALVQALAAGDGCNHGDIKALAERLAGSMQPDDWAATLNAVVPSARADQAEALTEAWFALATTVQSSLARTFLANLKVLTADGRWRLANELTTALAGVPSRYVPHARVREWLGVDELGLAPPAASDARGQPRRELSPDQVVSHIEKCVAGTVQRSVLGAVFSLTGSAGLVRAVEDWLGQQRASDVRRGLGVVPDPFADAGEVHFQLSRSKADETTVPGLCGGEICIRLGKAACHLLDGDPRRWIEELGRIRRPHIDIVLRECAFASLDAAQRAEVLKDTAVALARAVLGAQRFAQLPFETWWTRVGTGSQVDIGPARGLLLDGLPEKLAEFRLDDDPKLAEVVQFLARIRRAKLDRLNSASDNERQRLDSEIRRAPEQLADLVAKPLVASALRNRVRAMLKTYAYSPASVLLELLQNADDALEQRMVMSRLAMLPEAARTVRVEVVHIQGAASPTLVFTHWGRVINEHGGSAFPEGKANQWDNDLYFMARFHVSAKRGGEAETGGVQCTGRFGLGFKSVHMISDDPVVRSGTLAFRLDAALVPNEVRTPALIAAEEVEGMLPTTITLPLAVEFDPAYLLEQVFSRLRPVAAVLTAMARQVMAIEVPVEHGGRVGFDAVDVPGVQGWSVSTSAVVVGDSGWPVRLLRYRPLKPARTLRTVLFALDNGIPTPMPKEIPSFWVVAPTEEDWELGYCLNGDFKLDTGRVRVDFKAEESTKVLDGLGEQLGQALAELVTAVQSDGEASTVLGCKESPSRFVGAIWSILAGGLHGQPVADRLQLLQRLHANDRGLGKLSSTLAVVPSGLDAPWPALVGPIAAQGTIFVASQAAASHGVQGLLAAIPELRASAGSVVTAEVAEVLSRLLRVQRRDFKVVGQLSAWSAPRSEQLSADHLDLLAPLAAQDCWESVNSEGARVQGQPSALEAWASRLTLTARGGGQSLISGLLLPPEAATRKDALTVKPESFDDELLRGAFAPDSAVASAEVAAQARRLDVFLRLRGELRADAALLAAWAGAAETVARQSAAARYLAEGTLGAKVCQAVKDRGCLPWARTREEWQAAAGRAGLVPGQSQTVEIGLFGPLQTWQQPPPPQPPSQPVSHTEAQKRLCELWDTWAEENHRLTRLQALRKELWPRDWNPDQPRQIGAWLKGDWNMAETKRAWMVLFLLAHVQGLGLKGEQHRGFAEQLLKRRSRRLGSTWFDRLFGDDAPDGTWTDFLDEWSRDRMGGYRPYGFWMRVLPDMYAATKWWKVYAESLRQGRTEALSPATDPGLSGDADSADVPAMAGAVNRLPWILGELKYFGVLPLSQSQSDPRRQGYEPGHILTNVLRRLGYFADRSSEQYTSECVHDWLAGLIGADRADFHGLGKLPLELDAYVLLRD